MLKFAAIVLVSIFAFVVIQAYNFQNSVYSQILYDELKELQWNDQLSNSRPRHEELGTDEKCGRKQVRSCCDELYFQVLKDKTKFIRRECYRELRHNNRTFSLIKPLSCESVTKYREDVACLAECVAKKKGVLNSNNTIIISNMQELMKQEFAKLQWLYRKIEDIISNCTKQTQPQRGGEIQIEKKEVIGCKTHILEFGQCIWAEIQLQCPQERIKDEKKCHKIREDLFPNSSDFIK